ncbi:aminoglycoside N-acetyltransferase AAC(6')-Iak [Stenotrophomonas pavanii]|uniref:Aminoglycoside N(6')-acetyltransferase type 1 n=1 Tax=Stenotrophomonas maltophilia TaxID=40324 RepID=V5XKM9_STEMA|nr:MULTISPECIES: aminoglycoside N-acetyltransferase AAC(6')-Iak [Stenotrophomonas]KRG82060.1 aminoglycoside 6'-acetyltransferase [Stenotrophomonas pavanii]MCU1045714.1 aminoglycoside N-acetyltransferase AAC(6')-Iak [Stenotrophomonas maltophilia]NGM52795.1 aminoglycoside N-acetyltransferase AAC(6')-Iak [Stenotrophomonas pavanii]BAO05513.1 aminoglycoside 6'-N-acetyltransferase [Stenotrophomonas maltophilia]BAO21229.1 aminoglycoside 6'-N-acetyltransferase [Stenotrophomonas maltophilia]
MTGSAATIRPAKAADAVAWAQLRLGLWPDADDPLETLVAALAEDAGAVFLACAAGGQAIGFAEVRLRHDYVNGTDSSPVGFLEGWYVQPQWQGRGVGRALLAAVRAWTRDAGCRELASDSRVEDVQAHAAHRACGFEETERVVYFRMPLEPSA